MLTGFFLGIYQFYDKSLMQSENLKQSFKLAQSTKLQNSQAVQFKTRSTHLLTFTNETQTIINVKNGQKFKSKLQNSF